MVAISEISISICDNAELIVPPSDEPRNRAGLNAVDVHMDRQFRSGVGAKILSPGRVMAGEGKRNGDASSIDRRVILC